MSNYLDPDWYKNLEKKHVSNDIWIDKKDALMLMYKDKTIHSVQCLMVLDNIHDFNVSRESDLRKVNKWCDPNLYEEEKSNTKGNCIFTMLFNKLNKMTKIYGLVFTKGMFSTGWEKQFLKVIITEKYIYNIPTKIFMCDYLKNSDCKGWSLDVGNPLTKNLKIKLTSEYDPIKKNESQPTKLLSSIFDGNKSTTSDIKNNSSSNFDFLLPYISYTDNEVPISYKWTNDINGKFLERKFPDKWGKGNVKIHSKRSCFCENNSTKDCNIIEKKCPWKRTDKVYSTEKYNVDDNLKNITKNILTYLKHKYGYKPSKFVSFDDLEFFFTLKCLGDFAQCLEAEKRNLFLMTADSMQMIIGTKVGAKMIDKTSRVNIAISNNTAIDFVIKSQHILLQNTSIIFKNGLPIIPKKLIKKISETYPEEGKMLDRHFSKPYVSNIKVIKTEKKYTILRNEDTIFNINDIIIIIKVVLFLAFSCNIIVVLS